MMTRRLLLAIAFTATMMAPAQAFAQLDETSWGVTVGFVPVWQVPNQLANLFGDVALDISGREFRFGVIRGTTNGGEWGISLVHKRLSTDSVVRVDDGADVISFVTDDAEMLGVELHRFFPFARVGRVQIGANVGGGVAQLRGFGTGSVEGPGSALSAPIRFADIFELAGRDLDIFPLARAEIAAAALIGERVKLRVGGGFNLPAVQVVSVSVSVLLGRD
jgi:hypothetical protein